jgi:hypothetical protein
VARNANRAVIALCRIPALPPYLAAIQVLGGGLPIPGRGNLVMRCAKTNGYQRSSEEQRGEQAGSFHAGTSLSLNVRKNGFVVYQSTTLVVP